MTGGNAPADAGRAKPGRLFLVGMMGAGKTTVGGMVAAHLGCPHLDSDVQVERMTGRRVPEILEDDGEAAFRSVEVVALAQAMCHRGPVVVSVGGGAVLDPENRELLRASGTVVWLRALPATLAGRVGNGEGRPLLHGDPAALARLSMLRAPLYAEVADLVIDVDDLGAQEVAEKLERLIGSLDVSR